MTIIYVNSNHGNDNGVGNETAPFKTLTFALKKATEGTIIQLDQGIYSEDSGEIFPLIIPFNVTIRGNKNNRGKEILIIGSGEYFSSIFKQQFITILVTQLSQIIGITITNPHKKGTGIWIESTNPTIAHNTLINCGREGIFVTGNSKPIIESNIFEDNGSSGIFLVRNAKGELRHNLCQNTGYGIAMTDDTAPLLWDNQLLDNRVGINLLRNAKPVLRRNLMEHNQNGGLIVAGEAQPDLGNIQDPAGNILKNNANIDLKNKTKFTIVSVGNELNPANIEGNVEFLGTIINHIWIKGSAIYSDIAGHWAEIFINSLVEDNLISGFADGTFRPEGKLTRGEYATIISKVFDFPRQVGSYGDDFKDIDSEFQLKTSIQKATEMGFLSAYPDYTFRPHQPLTRIEVLVSLINGLGLTGGNPHILNIYSDRAQIPSYAVKKVAIATQKGLVVNYPNLNQLNPNQSITRGEMAVFLYQALVIMGEYPVINSPHIVNYIPKISYFKDIKSHWAEEFIHHLANLGLIRGFNDGNFYPDETINRGEYANLIAQIFNPKALLPPTKFFDISDNLEGLSGILEAYQGGFLTCFPDQTFHPEQPLRKVNLIVSLTQGLGLPSEEDKYLNFYQDYEDIPTYALGAIASATQAGIIVNHPHPHLLQPKKEVTRAEAFAMIYQGLVYQQKAIPINSPYLVS
jgi:parallel beta-helix repeat protein